VTKSATKDIFYPGRVVVLFQSFINALNRYYFNNDHSLIIIFYYELLKFVPRAQKSSQKVCNCFSNLNFSILASKYYLLAYCHDLYIQIKLILYIYNII